MNKLMIYPFNRKFYEIGRYAHLLEGYELAAVVSPPGYGYEGKDISFVDDGEHVGLKITSDYESNLKQVDSVLFGENIYQSDLNFYIEKINKALELGKDVIITKEIEKKFSDSLLEVPKQISVIGNNLTETVDFSDNRRYLKEISVPVILMFSIGAYCDGFALELRLMEKFKRDGYKISGISSKGYGALFGIHSVPDYMYQEKISEEDKIVNFNWYVENIIKNESPDLVIIDVQEAIMPYTDRLLNQFGIIPYMISNAMKADIGILNLYYGTPEPDYFNMVRELGKYKFDIEIEYFNVSNTKMVVDEFNALNPLSYVFVDKDTVMKSVADFNQQLQTHIFHVNDNAGTEEAYQKIQDELSENPAVVSIW